MRISCISWAASLLREVGELADPGDARHEHEPGKARVVQKQDGGEGEVADGDGVGGEPGIEAGMSWDVRCLRHDSAAIVIGGEVRPVRTQGALRPAIPGL